MIMSGRNTSFGIVYLQFNAEQAEHENPGHPRRRHEHARQGAAGNIEVHLSNPTARGTTSTIQQVCKGSVYGFGIYSYRLALEGLKQAVR